MAKQKVNKHKGSKSTITVTDNRITKDTDVRNSPFHDKNDNTITFDASIVKASKGSIDITLTSLGKSAAHNSRTRTGTDSTLLVTLTDKTNGNIDTPLDVTYVDDPGPTPDGAKKTKRRTPAHQGNSQSPGPGRLNMAKAKGGFPAVNHTRGEVSYLTILDPDNRQLQVGQVVNARGTPDGSLFSGPIVEAKPDEAVARLTCTDSRFRIIDGVTPSDSTLTVTITNSDGTTGPVVDNIQVTYVDDIP
jgi:hypothetical protein